MVGEPTAAKLQSFPRMVHWFDPALLSKLVLRVITADVFGQYADRRLIVAALDPAPKEELVARSELPFTLPATERHELWIDYVSDLGDGFDSTYAIAYLLAQEALTIDGTTLQRGDLLIMGGDQVYPTATRKNYADRMLLPYELALPNQRRAASHPPVFLIPGNHDWYDGLVVFLAKFCRKKPTPVGNWRTQQRRSYFAIHLTDRWWLWAIDIALTRDMDQPQADYFVAIAEAMPKRSHIILCSAEPGWYKAEDPDAGSFRTLSYAAWIAENAGKQFDVPVVLSGDTHHYSRYASPDYPTQFITSGGGGAFLHGTNQLKDIIETPWLRAKPKLSLKTEPQVPHAPSHREACYPSREKSRELLWRNLAFPFLNYGFSVALGVIYWACALALRTWPPDAYAWTFLLLLVGFGGYTNYQEGFSRRLWVCIPHALAHLLAIAALSWVFAHFNAYLPGFLQGSRAQFWMFGAEMILAGGAVAGFIFGVYLLLTCRYADLNQNDAFSAMRLDTHRHFLRLHIEGDLLTIYPVGIDQHPTRDEWIENEQSKIDPRFSALTPVREITLRLIEDAPITILAGPPPVTETVAPEAISEAAKRAD